MIARREIKIQPDETYLELYHKLGKLGANVLVETMHGLPEILNTATPQTEEQVTYGNNCMWKFVFTLKEHISIL